MLRSGIQRAKSRWYECGVSLSGVEGETTFAFAFAFAFADHRDENPNSTCVAFRVHVRYPVSKSLTVKQ